MKRCIYVNPFVRYIERVRFCLGAVCQGPGFIRKTVEGGPFSFQKAFLPVSTRRAFCPQKETDLFAPKQNTAFQHLLPSELFGGRCIYPTA